MELNMEQTIKQALLWNTSEWANLKSILPGLRRQINSLKFWSLQLAPAMRDNNVIITLYNPGKHAFVSLEQVIEAILEVDASISITGYARFKNKRYIAISFLDSETRNKVSELLRFVNSNYVVFLHWACSQEITCNLFWLSNQVDLVQVMEYFSQFMRVLSVVQIKTTLSSGMVLPSGSFRACGLLKDSVSILDIPHFDIIDQLQVLITIPGRNSVCYRCLETGHLAKCCRKLFCRLCYSFREAKHDCKTKVINCNDTSLPSHSTLLVKKSSTSMDTGGQDIPALVPSPSYESPLPFVASSSIMPTVKTQVLPCNTSVLLHTLPPVDTSLAGTSSELHIPFSVLNVPQFSDALSNTALQDSNVYSLSISSEEDDALQRVGLEVQNYQSMLAQLQQAPFEYSPPAWLKSTEPSPYLDHLGKQQEKGQKHKVINTKKKSHRKTQF